jgi:aminoglycoside 6-adenylyltransferase
MRPFATREVWLEAFGQPMVRFRDQGRLHDIATETRLVLYADGTKIDYTVWPVELLQRVQEEPQLPDCLDVGYRVLLDKDHLAQGLKPPTYTAHIPRKPTDQEFQALVEEFWWESTYVAKNLWRDELIFAKYNLEYVMKLELLVQLLEWRIELNHDWSLKPGVCGRGLKKHLDAGTWSELAGTYVGADIDENWAALFKTTGLFRRIAVEAGSALGYAYPQELDQQVTSYLHHIKSLDSSADRPGIPRAPDRETGQPDRR